jgi:hypothetical protein
LTNWSSVGQVEKAAFDRKALQREYMRKRRAAKAANCTGKLNPETVKNN